MKNHISFKTAGAAALLLAFTALPLSAQAKADQLPAPSPLITVTGQGDASIAPDLAILNLSVLREADTARQALTDNNEAMAKVLAAMKEDGIEERDLQTGGFSIQPRYVYPDDKNGLTQPKISGYSVSNTLTVKVRDLTKLGNILDQSVTLGVNQGGDITFTNDDPSTAITEARKEAIKDAVAKAKTLTEAAGVSVGKVISINETSAIPTPRPIGFPRMVTAQSMAADSVPVATGENTYNVNVTVTFEIKQD